MCPLYFLINSRLAPALLATLNLAFDMLRIFIGLSIAFTYTLMVMGNVVTTTGSGLACPDWPLCYGTVIPPFELQIWFEWSHRLLGGTTGILILSTTIIAWLTVRGLERTLITTALGLLGLGAVFGGVIVLIEAPLLEGALHVGIISFHIVLSTIIFTLMIFAFRVTQKGVEYSSEERTYVYLFAIVFIQVIIGIFVRYGQASLACPDFPLCRGEILPTLIDGKVAIHVIHRAMALLIFTLVTGYMIFAIKAKYNVRNAVITFILVLLQATFGANIVWSGMFLPYIVLHGATGFLTLGWLAYRSAPIITRKQTSFPSYM